jgi:hypothetical protein
MEEITLVKGKLIFDLDKKCFFMYNHQKEPVDPGVRLYPGNMTKLMKALPGILMKARESDDAVKKILQVKADLLKEGEPTDHLEPKLKDCTLASFTISEWGNGKFALKAETIRYSQDVNVWVKFMYQHEKDPAGSPMRTYKGQVRISINKENLTTLDNFVQRCIIMLKLAPPSTPETLI